ncbi:hypothetical protein KAU19_02405 [Candidatus Parcubacteria bacterium]|nr:hypothetical protein [Candidatus Parcubacteria bacterium]
MPKFITLDNSGIISHNRPIIPNSAVGSFFVESGRRKIERSKLTPLPIV